MNRFQQLGQGMTEYMVVLGVTGAVLLATTTDVTTLFDNVHNGYRTQSSEMNKVQLYNSYKVRFNENEPDDKDFDDGEEVPPYDEPQPDVEDQLPSIEWVYDANGRLLGQMQGDTLIDEAGNIIAWCQRSETGECVFTDADGNVILGGSSSSRQWVDEDGNELPLMALVRNGRVMGFAYQFNGRFYSSSDRKLLDPQPAGMTARPMRRVVDLDEKGVPQTAGYELDGRMYSIAETLETEPTFDDAIDSEAKELVTVIFDTPPTSNWQGYAPCLVMPSGWTGKEDVGVDGVLGGAWEKKFNDPTLRLGDDGTGGFINGASSSDCNGSHTVTYTPGVDGAPSTWVLTR